MRNWNWLPLIAVVALAMEIQAVPAKEEEEIARLYKAGVAGDKQAVEKCIAFLEATLKRQPSNELARVYLGSAYTLRSRDMGFGPGKLAMLKQGLALMDAAVAAAPHNYRLRLVRGLTTDSLPFFLGRKQSTREDFELLAAIARRDPAQFTAGDLQAVREHAQRPP